MRDHPPVEAGDPMIAISMMGDLIVLRPNGRLDLDSTHTLVNAVDAAAGTDTAVLIDLDGSATDSLPDLRLHTPSPGSSHQVAVPAPTIDVIAPGCVRLSAPGNHWTIDLTEQRFCRSSGPVDRRFVGADDWTGIRSIWATSDGVTIVTAADSLISTATRRIAPAVA